MGTQMGITRIDGRGRITVPQEGGIVVRRVHSKKDAARKMRGIITAKNAVTNIDPMDLKRLLHASD